MRRIIMFLAAVTGLIGTGVIAQQKVADQSEPPKAPIEERIDTTAPGVNDEITITEDGDGPGPGAATQGLHVPTREWQPPAYHD
jgi:hypothetical protein